MTGIRIMVAGSAMTVRLKDAQLISLKEGVADVAIVLNLMYCDVEGDCLTDAVLNLQTDIPPKVKRRGHAGYPLKKNKKALRAIRSLLESDHGITCQELGDAIGYGEAAICKLLKEVRSSEPSEPLLKDIRRLLLTEHLHYKVTNSLQLEHPIKLL